jgi:hypothetical protein
MSELIIRVGSDLITLVGRSINHSKGKKEIDEPFLCLSCG